MACCPGTTSPLTRRHRVRVRYAGARPICVQGMITGSEYRFTGLDRVQLVDPRDALTIVRNPLFRAEGVVEISSVEGGHAQAGGTHG